MDTIANFEQILLKNLLQNNRFLGLVSGILTEKSFSNIANKEIFKIIKEYYLTYSKAPNIPEVVASARNIPNSELKVLISDNLKIIVPMEPITNETFLIEETIKFVKNAMITDALIIGADGISKNSDELKMKAFDMMTEAQKIRIDTDLGLEFSDIDSRLEYYKQKLVGISSGQKDLDDRIGSFLPKTLSIIAAPPGIGKSLLLADIAANNLRNGKNVLFITLEMSEFETVKRIDANVLDLPINDLATIDDSIIKTSFENKKSSLGKMFTKEFPPGVFSPLMLKGLLDSFRIEKNIEFDLIMVDYLGLMKSDRLNVSVGPYLYIKSITEELRAVSIMENKPIISPAQLNRGAINNTDADSSSLAESLGILMTADLVIMLLQTPEMKEQLTYIFKIAKNRITGNTSSFIMNIDYTKMRFICPIIQPSNKLSVETENALTFNETSGNLNDISILDNFDFGEI